MSETIFNFHDTVLLATSFQSVLFIILVLFAKRDHHISDFFLIGFFVAQAMIPLHLLIIYGDDVRLVALEISPNLFRIFDFAYWLEGPLLLWYTRSLLYRKFSLQRRDAIFLIPAVLYLVYTLATFYAWTDPEKIAYIENYRVQLAPSVPHTVEAIREMLFVMFGVMCLLEILFAQQHIHDRYSNIRKNDIVWLAVLIAAFMVVRVWSLLVVSIAFLKPDLGAQTFNSLGLVGNYIEFVMINSLIFFSLTRSSLFLGKVEKDQQNDQIEETKADLQLTRKIEQHMAVNKPYLSHFLNLEQLAQQLDMHPRALSNAIRQNFDTNFYEFINSYRIKEARILLEDPDNPTRTMIEILGESGFNSKATFNAFFKKLVGKTPTQYRKSMLGKTNTQRP